MSISEIELKFLVNHIKEIIDDVYYVSNIYPITKSSLVIKFHHSQKNDISLLVSTFGICVTKYKYSMVEDNDAIKKIKSELERSKLTDVSVFEGERIVQFIFQNVNGLKYHLIIELFGNGNVILCNESLKILALINPINVRHRVLKPGLNYAPPPPRGVNPFSITFENFLSLVNATKEEGEENIDIKKWLGRNLSISKKFVEHVINNSGIKNKKIKEISDDEFKSLFDNLISLIKNISSGIGHEPCIVLDESGNSADISPIVPSNFDLNQIKKFSSYSDAVDEFLNNLIVNSDATKNSDLEKRLELLEHDLQEQEKAKNLVISKSAKLRDFATLLMQQMDAMMNIQTPIFQKLLFDSDAKILNIRGKYILEIVDEKMPLDSDNFNLPKLSSSLFGLAKEKERGLVTIENSQLQLREQIGKLKQKKDKKPLPGIKVLTNKEWYEKYRWFFTSDGLLAIGGRDASSNSVIIRKLLTENDYVFHAEANGSPFFILQNANNSNTDISQSILEVSQATVAFSRSWKSGLSSSDAYWVLPSQLKKGAPTGQYLPKGSFVIEGKRNFVKNLEIKLAIGLSFIDNKSLFVVGPYHAVKKRSICMRNLLPSGLDVVKASKKIKADFVDYSIKNDFPKYIVDHLKSLSIDEIVRVLPVGQCKLLPVEKGDLKDNFIEITEK